MEQLIPISGYAKTYKELCTKIAQPGEFYNVFDECPFMTYMKTENLEVGDTLETTDVLGWFENRAELESNAKPNSGDIYITGSMSPYTRWKAIFESGKLDHWEEDGQEERKIVKNYKSMSRFGMAHLDPEEGIYYSIGKEVPYKLFGVISEWEPVGTFISFLHTDIDKLKYQPEKRNPGEVAFVQGIYYLYNGDEWEQIDIQEPMKNVYKHSYTDGTHKYRLREGMAYGTLEYFAPKE